jgi:hypothetical protein
MDGVMHGHFHLHGSIFIIAGVIQQRVSEHSVFKKIDRTVNMGWEAFCLALVLSFSFSFLKEIGHHIPLLFSIHTCMHRIPHYPRDACPPAERDGNTVAIVLSGWHIHSSPVCSRSYETTLALALAWIAFILFGTVY